MDPDTTAPVIAEMFVDGNPAATFTASQSRPDVGGAYPPHGDGRGLDKTLSLSGHPSVPVSAVNVGPSDPRAEIGCTIATQELPPARARSSQDERRDVEHHRERSNRRLQGDGTFAFEPISLADPAGKPRQQRDTRQVPSVHPRPSPPARDISSVVCRRPATRLGRDRLSKRRAPTRLTAPDVRRKGGDRVNAYSRYD